MRIYSNPYDAIRETERELVEMGIDVRGDTMQDKKVTGDAAYFTRELQGYAFKIINYQWDQITERDALSYVHEKELNAVCDYVTVEFEDRVSVEFRNPGRSWHKRPHIWDEFLHDGKFAYTYAERLAPQLDAILDELKHHPQTRQAILTIHSNINPGPNEPDGAPNASEDLMTIGGHGRIPCSMYYQFMRRLEAIDCIYTMRSCDFLTHFSIDLMLALRLQCYFASQLDAGQGAFTYFVGSLHAYQKDMLKRKAF